jgi:hypothetical protein
VEYKNIRRDKKLLEYWLILFVKDMGSHALLKMKLNLGFVSSFWCEYPVDMCMWYVVFLLEQFGGRIGRLICKPLVKQLVEVIGGLNEVIYESKWVHLIRKKNVGCFSESCLQGHFGN